MGSGRGVRRVGGLVATALSLLILGLAAPASNADPCDRPLSGADLSLALDVSQAQSGNSLYTLTITNNGEACASGVTIQDTLPFGSAFVGFSDVGRSSWSCSGTSVVLCSLQSTIPAPPGNNKAALIVEATPGSTEEITNNAIVGASVTDPDCPATPPAFCLGAGANNEAWGSFGTTASTGTANANFLTASVTRPPSSPASIAVQLAAPTSPLAAPLSPPCDPSCLADRQVVITTPPTGNELFSIVIAIPAPGLNKPPPATAFRFSEELGVWQNLTTCRRACNAEVGWVDSVTLDKKAGVVYLTILTSHNGHLTK